MAANDKNTNAISLSVPLYRTLVGYRAERLIAAPDVTYKCPGSPVQRCMGIRANCWFLPQRARSSAAPSTRRPSLSWAGDRRSTSFRRLACKTLPSHVARIGSGDCAVTRRCRRRRRCRGTPTRAHPRWEASISNGFSMGLSPEGLIVVGTRTDTRNDGSDQGRFRRLRASLMGRPNRRKASRLPATRTLRGPVFDCPDRIGEDQKSEDASQRG